MLETLFSEVLMKGEWLRIWDNVVSQHPGYMLLVVVAYLTTARHTLFKCNQKEDFEVRRKMLVFLLSFLFCFVIVFLFVCLFFSIFFGTRTAWMLAR